MKKVEHQVQSNTNRPVTLDDLNRLIVQPVMKTLQNCKETLQDSTEAIYTIVRYCNQVINNNSNIIYIDPTDDLFQMVCYSMGRKLAIDFVRNSALTPDIEGDLRILDQSYMINDYGDKVTIFPVMFTNSKCNAVVYTSRIRGIKTESLSSFKNMIASLLSNCYSNIFSRLTHPDRNKATALDDHEITLWLQHQDNLMNDEYKQKIIDNMTIIERPNVSLAE